MTGEGRVVKVAVIGSGLAGLTTAFLLATTKSNDDVTFDVHIFEKSDSIGMDDKSISVSTPGHGHKDEIRIDVPMRSFQGGYYPNLIALYNFLGVSFRPSNFSYSFSSLYPSRSNGFPTLHPRLLYNGRSGLGGVSLPAESLPPSAPIVSLTNGTSITIARYGLTRLLFVTLPTLLVFALSTLRLLFNFVRLGVLSAPYFYSRQSIETLREWTARTTPSGYFARITGSDKAWIEFIQQVLVPLFSAVCTASEPDIYAHPVSEILEYIWMTHFTSHYVVAHGVQDAVKRITRSVPTENVHLSSTITGIRTESSGRTAEISFSSRRGISALSGFQHIIFATQANSAIPILESYRTSLPLKSSQQHVVDAQITCLRRFQYVRTVVINHTDEAFLPSHAADRRDLNLVCATPEARDYSPSHVHGSDHPDSMQSDHCVPPTYTMATHIIRRPPIGPSDNKSQAALYQTTNPIIPPRPDSVLSSSVIERAVLTADSKQAQRELMTYEEGGSWLTRLHVTVRRWPFISLRYRQRKLGPLQGAGVLAKVNLRSDESTGPGIWFCGSYAHPGIPLLEACVTSALNVVENGIYVAESVSAKAEWAQ